MRLVHLFCFYFLHIVCAAAGKVAQPRIFLQENVRHVQADIEAVGVLSNSDAGAKSTGKGQGSSLDGPRANVSTVTCVSYKPAMFAACE